MLISYQYIDLKKKNANIVVRTLFEERNVEINDYYSNEMDLQIEVFYELMHRISQITHIKKDPDHNIEEIFLIE